MSAQHILRPWLNVGPGSGQPNAPRGEPAFVPLNPWGRGFPAPPRPEKQPLCQVVVKDTTGKETRVGPAMSREFAEMLRLSIAEQVKLGREKTWSNPRVVTLIPDLGRPVFEGV